MKKIVRSEMENETYINGIFFDCCSSTLEEVLFILKKNSRVQNNFNPNHQHASEYSIHQFLLTQILFKRNEKRACYRTNLFHELNLFN